MRLPGYAKWRNWIKTTSFLVGLPIAALQFVQGPPATNPPVVPERTIEASLRLTPAVAGLLKRACADCHSNQTEWPMYSKIAPFSWPIAADVHKARSAMNLSEWSTGIGRRPALAMSALAAACADVDAGNMPLPRYLLLHPGARLSAGDKRMFCDWTHAEITRLRASK
jgi:hypothetical protein